LTVKPVEIVEADLERPEHQRDVRAMTEAYARDQFGNGAPLPVEVAERLIAGLRAHPTTLIFLAYLDGQAAGIATCFRGFSTFYARPTINIHDLAVLPGQRGAGIGRQLLEAVAAKGRALGCCKLTLEVQENNARARRLYESLGFRQAVYVESAGGVLYYTRTP
jgi:ribosomal protein S18 acetylase RimI-like enzyme